MNKKLKDVFMFFAGDHEKQFPSRVFFSYKVSNGKTTGEQQVFVVDDPDTSQLFNVFFKKSYNQIKEIEGIK
jgi:hypothetical protein